MPSDETLHAFAAAAALEMQAAGAAEIDAAAASKVHAAAAPVPQAVSKSGFDAAADTVHTAARLARAMLRSPACAKFFFGPQLRWAGNEVPVSTSSAEVLRIDRLVCLQQGAAPGTGGGEWWVLDYKLHHAPQELAEDRDQLLRYREAVRRLQPAAVVRCAFITGAGELIEIDA